MKPEQPPAPEAFTSGGSSSIGDWVAGGAFFGSIVSGMLLGYLADRWLGTDPWLVIIGIVVGSYSGFMRMWQLSKQMTPGQIESGQMAPPGQMEPGQMGAGPDAQ